VYPRITEISAIANPTLVMWGEEDLLVPVEDAQKFAASIPDARVRVYSGVGHMPMEEAPERSAADLRAFLRGEI
jgi:pimeloyl-ACP methyl ester carboxylesterase